MKLLTLLLLITAQRIKSATYYGLTFNYNLYVETMNAVSTYQNKKTALWSTFLLLLSFNILLQFESTEKLFNSVFSSTPSIEKSQADSAICGSQSHFNAPSPQSAIWASLSGCAGLSAGSSLLKYFAVVATSYPNVFPSDKHYFADLVLAITSADSPLYFGLSPPKA